MPDFVFTMRIPDDMDPEYIRRIEAAGDVIDNNSFNFDEPLLKDLTVAFEGVAQVFKRARACGREVSE